MCLTLRSSSRREQKTGNDSPLLGCKLGVLYKLCRKLLKRLRLAFRVGGGGPAVLGVAAAPRGVLQERRVARYALRGRVRVSARVSVGVMPGTFCRSTKQPCTGCNAAAFRAPPSPARTLRCPYHSAVELGEGDATSEHHGKHTRTPNHVREPRKRISARTQAGIRARAGMRDAR